MMKRLSAIFLIVVIMFGVFGVAFAEKVLMEGEALLALFQPDYEIINPKYDGLYENKYVSEDGKIEKWYCSNLPEIDGLKRTDEDRLLISWDYNPSKDAKCDVEQEHAHLYFSLADRHFVPAYSEVQFLDGNNNERIKTKVLLTANVKAIEILNQFRLYRACDNLPQLRTRTEDATSRGIEEKIFLVPGKLTDGSLELKIILDNSSVANYTDDMKGYLINMGNGYVGSDFDREKDKTLTLNKVSQ